MSSNTNLAPTGQLSGINLIQPSTYWIQNRFNNGAYIPPVQTRYGYSSGNYIGGRINHAYNYNVDINGLHQPAGVAPNYNRNWRTVATGMDNAGGTYSNIFKHDLSRVPRGSTPAENLTGMIDKRKLGLSNDDLYYNNAAAPPPPPQSAMYRIDKNIGRSTMLAEGLLN